MDLEGVDELRPYRDQIHQALLQGQDLLMSLKAPEIPRLDLNKTEKFLDLNSSLMFKVAPEVEGARKI